MEKHNYGLGKSVVEYTPVSYAPIRIEKTYKQVILVNVKDCENRITVEQVRDHLRGFDWFEWENLLAHWLVEAIVEAIKNGKAEADISKLFTCELRGENTFGLFTKSQMGVISFLMNRLFKCQEENEEMMRVRFVEMPIAVI